MNILCLDLALANTGVVVIEVGPSKDSLLFVTTIHTEKTDKEILRKSKLRVSDDDWRRTAELVDAFKNVINTYGIQRVFIECPTGGSKSAHAAKSMALARGAACAVMHGLNLPTTLITPFEAKRAATGNIKASKKEVKGATKTIFPDFDGWIRGKRGQILEGPNEHIFDALSVYLAATNTKMYKELRP